MIPRTYGACTDAGAGKCCPCNHLRLVHTERQQNSSKSSLALLCAHVVIGWEGARQILQHACTVVQEHMSACIILPHQVKLSREHPPSLHDS